MQQIEQLNPDEEIRRKKVLVVGSRVRVIGTYYGPDLTGHAGVLVNIDPHSPCPYHVAVERVPGIWK